MTSDDRISAFFGDRLARSLFESLTNRNDFGARRLQFSASGRDIERVSARTNDHDHSVSCDERWIFFNNTKPRSFWHVMTFTSKGRDLFSGFDGPEEQAMSKYYYLDDKIRFPFQAKCIAPKVVSPLRKGDTVESAAYGAGRRLLRRHARADPLARA